MPKKKPPVNLKFDSGPLEKSLSSPEISEIGKEISKIKPEDLSNRQEVEEALQSNNFKKQRRGSWLSKLLRTFRRKRNRTTEPEQQSQINPGIQKSPSAQFYTAPPKEFLVEATNRNDDVDAPVVNKDNNSEPVNEDTSSTEANSSIKLYKRPNPVLPSSPRPPSTLIHELKKSLSVKKQEQIIKDDDRPTYSNISDLKNPGSTRRKSRPSSVGSLTLEQCMSELDHIYEATWVPDANDPNIILKSSSQTVDKRDFDTIPDFQAQPMEPLHKFPKPKPPVNRRPSTRRGSQPEVTIRTKSSDSGPVCNRRSNAELEEVIKRLSDIPAPDAVPASKFTPTPRKRTKFFNTPPTSPTDDETIDSSGEENITGTWFSFEKVSGNSRNITPTIIKPNLKTNQTESIEVDEQTNAANKERNIKSKLGKEHIPIRKPTITRNQSFPGIKMTKNKDTLFLLVDTVKDDTSQKENDDCEEDKLIKYYPLQRWKTMPTRFCFKSGKLVHKPVDTPTIVVIPVKDGHLSDEDNDDKIAVILNAEIRPPTQNTATQTCPLLTEVSNETISLTPHPSEAINHATDTNEIEKTGQNTPPNTPDQGFENNPPSSTTDNISEQEISNSAIFHGIFKSSTEQHLSSETTEGSVVLIGKNDFTEQNINSNESESSNYVLSKLRSNLKHVSREENAYARKTSIESGDISSDVAMVSCFQESLLSDQTEMTAHSKETPTKPQRVSRKPQVSPKPLLLPRPEDFVRRAGLRKKRNSSSEEKTTTPKDYLHFEDKHVASNNNNIRRSSLFPEEIMNEPDEDEETLSIQRAKRRSKSIV